MYNNSGYPLMKSGMRGDVNVNFRVKIIYSISPIPSETPGHLVTGSLHLPVILFMDFIQIHVKSQPILVVTRVASLTRNHTLLRATKPPTR